VADRDALVLSGTLEEAQYRKVDTLIARARLQKHHKLLDIGFGWGGVALRAAQTVGCRVWGITLSKEQKALAEERVSGGSYTLYSYKVYSYTLCSHTLCSRMNICNI
jgi:cyclopropane-fatty-acyl-phospholipid synthase